jgi:hypothetical protein
MQQAINPDWINNVSIYEFTYHRYQSPSSCETTYYSLIVWVLVVGGAALPFPSLPLVPLPTTAPWTHIRLTLRHFESKTTLVIICGRIELSGFCFTSRIGH